MAFLFSVAYRKNECIYSEEHTEKKHRKQKRIKKPKDTDTITILEGPRRPLNPSDMGCQILGQPALAFLWKWTTVYYTDK